MAQPPRPAQAEVLPIILGQAPVRSLMDPVWYLSRYRSWRDFAHLQDAQCAASDYVALEEAED
jgi:hypothetical protein